MINSVLNGFRVLVCRAEPNASTLCDALSAVGAAAQALPCLEIKPLELSPEAKNLIYDLDLFQDIIVVSQFAAQFMIEQVDTIWPQYPAKQTWYGIGRASSQLLRQAGFEVFNANADLSSEQLLEAQPLQQLAGKKCLIVKGKGGRSKLEQGLRQRGAKVSELILYERVRPNYVDAYLQERLLRFQPTHIIALSNETIDNLFFFSQQVNASPFQLPIVVPSARVAKHAQTLGFQHTLISTQLKPIDLIKALKRTSH